MSGRLNNRNHGRRSCGFSLKKTSKAHFCVPLLTFESTQSINASSRRLGPRNPEVCGHGPVGPKQYGHPQAITFPSGVAVKAAQPVTETAAPNATGAVEGKIVTFDVAAA